MSRRAGCKVDRAAHGNEAAVHVLAVGLAVGIAFLKAPSR